MMFGLWGSGEWGESAKRQQQGLFLIQNSNRFDGACFLADIKENKCGMHSLQNILLSELLRKRDNYVNNKEDRKHMIAHRLWFKKVLVVLDDIDHDDHWDNLAGDLDWFGKGSRIIATARDKHLIGKNDVVYEVTTLRDQQAIKLFNQYAFKEEIPGKCFEKLSLEVVSHAKGLPLALKVWGSFLYKRDIIEWKSAIEQMKIKSKSEIVEKLKISYDRLETIQQDIFLDITCFLRGNEEDYIMSILKSCYSGVNIELSVLIDKSLVFIDNNKIQMHDLIQDMGKYIVKMQKDPGERSRLWDTTDLEEVMVNNIGIMSVEAIWCTYIQKLCFSKEAMNNMKRLRILCIRHTDDERRSPWFEYFPSFSSLSDSEFVPYNSNCHDGSIEYLPDNLCWFVWHDYPWKSLPENFKPQKLVHLDLRWSSLHELWTKRKMFFPSLRKLDLTGSISLMQTPDFMGMPNLEYLNLSGCTSLKEVHHSLGYSRKLIRLDLSHCERLETFPYVNLESLEYLYLQYCSSLEKFPEILGRMKPKLDISVGGSEIRELPSSIIQRQGWLTYLDLSYLNFVALPSSFGKLKNLVTLHLGDCSKLESLPEEIGDLENLEWLEARGTLISQPPSSIIRLNKLKILNFAKQETGGDLVDGVFFVFPHVNEGLRSLETLMLSYCNLIDGGLPEDIGCLSSLKNLYLQGNNFEHLPRSIAQLGALQYLNLSDCKRLTQLPEDIGCLSSLEELYLNGNNFEHLPRSIAQLGALRSLDLSECRRLTHLPQLPPEIYTLHADCHMALKSIHNLVTKKKKSQRLIFTPLSYGAYNGSIYNSFAHALFQNISSLQHDISASDSLSLREFTIEHPGKKIPSWFHHRGTHESVSVNLPDNWYVRDNFLGFAVCYSGRIIETKAYLIPVCNRMPWMIQNLSLSYGLISDTESTIHFFFVPLASLWDTSKANGKTPNDYGIIGLTFSGHRKDYGFRLLYKDELEHEALLQMRGDNDEPTEHSIGTRRSTPVSSKTLQLFPTSPGF